jgi:signal transduction histidine kinase
MSIPHTSRSAVFRRRYLAFSFFVCYGGLIFLDARAFLARSVSFMPLVASWKQLGFSALSAFLFLAIGTLVWLYARNRTVAWLLFGFCSAMALSFAVSPAAKENDPTFSAIGSISSGYALLAFSVLLLFFPYNFWDAPNASRVTRIYLVVLLIGLVTTPLYASLEYIFVQPLPFWVLFSYYGFYFFALLGIFVTIFAAYRWVSTARQRYQLRLFVTGVMLAFIPALLLTVLPSALSLPPQYIVDSQISTSSLVLLPLSLGYSILRYELMLFDSTLRKVSSQIIGVLGVGLVLYVMILVFGLFGSVFTSSALLAIVVTTLCALFAWHGMQIFTERFFYTDQTLYRKTIEQPDVMNADRASIHEVAHILAGALARLFDTPHACLFVLDESSRRYYFVPESTEERNGSIGQQELLLQVGCQSTEEGSAWLNESHPLVQSMRSMMRPLSLARALHAEAKLFHGKDWGFGMRLAASESLVAPIFAHGSMIGIIVASKRPDDQVYAGPELAAMQLLQARLSPILETACLYAQAHRRAEMMKVLYSNNRSDKLLSLEKLQATFAQRVSEVFGAGAEFWSYNEQSKELTCDIHQGSGPYFLACKRLVNVEPMALTPWFSSDPPHVVASSGNPNLSWVAATTLLADSFACFPLEHGQRLFGMFVLTFSDFHYFSVEEQHDLVQLTGTYVAEMDHARMTTELYDAYERLKELDRLKDEFIITASHELRTPLTAVQGYLELLGNYGDSLEKELRAQFIATAQHQCEELVLQVNAILDAGKASTPVKSVHVEAVSLADVLREVREFFAPTLIEQERILAIDIPDAPLFVLADQGYLKQVLANLLTNALKYSPCGSSLEVWTGQEDTTLSIHVKDYGSGIPPEAQQHIFERFVRLERDMNSPVRGIGLGLSLCKQLLEAMDGRIWVESSGIAGEGSTFSFSLRIASQAQITERAQSSDVVGATSLDTRALTRWEWPSRTEGASPIG